MTGPCWESLAKGGSWSAWGELKYPEKKNKKKPLKWHENDASMSCWLSTIFAETAERLLSNIEEINITEHRTGRTRSLYCHCTSNTTKSQQPWSGVTLNLSTHKWKSTENTKATEITPYNGRRHLVSNVLKVSWAVLQAVKSRYKTVVVLKRQLLNLCKWIFLTSSSLASQLRLT